MPTLDELFGTAPEGSKAPEPATPAPQPDLSFEALKAQADCQPAPTAIEILAPTLEEFAVMTELLTETPAAPATSAAPDLSVLPAARYSYITGPAGTGKTTLVRAWRDQLETKTATPGALTLAATTGIAAVNLGDAVTINSLLGYFDTASLQDAVIHGHIQSRLRRLRRAGVQRLVLDEVSMLEAEALTLLVSAVEDVNNEAEVLEGQAEEIGLTLVGDFLQLPPIGEKPEKGRRTTKAKYAFEAPEWEKYFAPHVVTLTKVHRQADPGFLRALAALRRGEWGEGLAALHPCFRPRVDLQFPGTTIFAKNAEVDRFNALRLRQLPGAPAVYTSLRWGKQRGEWKNIPETLVVKPGALVMILANLYEGMEEVRWLAAANGDLADFLEKIDNDRCRVRLHRTGRELVVGKVTRKFEQPTGLANPKYETVGEVKYLPLRVAWATTVHKSQGLTLDEVQLDITDPFWTAPAMTYVGMSRARSLEGLTIVGRPEMLQARAVFDPRVTPWR